MVGDYLLFRNSGIFYTYFMASKKIIEKIDSLLSKEKGTIFKDPGGKVNVCLVYPNTYRIGMSTLGFQGIYTLLNSRQDIVCERAFLPDEDDIEEYRRTDTEIISLESKKPLSRFEIIAFSVSFENNYPNILKILDMSNIPLRAGDRREIHPLIVMGGICAFFNPEPVADFFDVCFVGEAEEMLMEFMDAYKGSNTRDELYKKAADIEGVYMPTFYNISYRDDGGISKRVAVRSAPEKIKRRFVRDISASGLMPSIITPETEFSGMYLTEAMRGCPWDCRFCVTGYVYNPVRRKGYEAVKKEIEGIGSLTGKVGLIAPSLTDYPYAKDVLCMDGVDFSITSLRASKRSAELIQYMRGKKSVSIAPEAGTQRLRNVVKKRITEEDILETSGLILSGGVENLRLYFMIGLPTEEQRDIEGIVSLIKKIRGASKKGNIVLTLSTFIPKPFTPFQWHPMEKIAVVKERLKFIKKALMPLKGVKVFHDVPKYAYMQGLFSTGDRRVSGAIEHMVQTDDWKKACLEAGIAPDFYMLRQKGFDETLPWDFIEHGISKEKLWSEYQEALGTRE